MKKSELSQLIREEIKKVMSEATPNLTPIAYTKDGNKPIYAGEYEPLKADKSFMTTEKDGPGDYVIRETGKNAALRVTKKLPDGKYGVEILVGWSGTKRYLVTKDSKTNTYEAYPVDERTYKKATTKA